MRVLTIDSLPAGENRIDWDGRDSEGNPLAEGSYTFAVELFDLTGAAVGVTTYRTGLVTGVKYIQGQAFLEVEGTLVPLTEVRRIEAEGP